LTEVVSKRFERMLCGIDEVLSMPAGDGIVGGGVIYLRCIGIEFDATTCQTYM
jgi:hypothetical protein